MLPPELCSQGYATTKNRREEPHQGFQSLLPCWGFCYPSIFCIPSLCPQLLRSVTPQISGNEVCLLRNAHQNDLRLRYIANHVSFSQRTERFHAWHFPVFISKKGNSRQISNFSRESEVECLFRETVTRTFLYFLLSFAVFSVLTIKYFKVYTEHIFHLYKQEQFWNFQNILFQASNWLWLPECICLRLFVNLKTLAQLSSGLLAGYSYLWSCSLQVEIIRTLCVTCQPKQTFLIIKTTV